MCDHSCLSKVEVDVIHAVGEPAAAEISDEITINNETGLWVNKQESERFSGPVALEDYPINQDACPTVYQKVPNCVDCSREVAIKYLEPGYVPTPGPIIINQEQNVLAPHGPPVIIRQVPDVPSNPDVVVFREAPPSKPEAPPSKVITIPGVLLPPPARKVVIERLPELPDKPQDVLIERWLPFQDVKRQVILNPKPADPIQCKTRNVVINWEKRNCCSVSTEIKDLGIEKADPIAYAQTHGETLLAPDQLPEIASEVQSRHGQRLAANDNTQFYMQLTGDIHGLNLIDLDAVGLGEYKQYLAAATPEEKVESRQASAAATKGESSERSSPGAGLSRVSGSASGSAAASRPASTAASGSAVASGSGSASGSAAASRPASTAASGSAVASGSGSASGSAAASRPASTAASGSAVASESVAASASVIHVVSGSVSGSASASRQASSVVASATSGPVSQAGSPSFGFASRPSSEASASPVASSTPGPREASVNTDPCFF